MQKELRALLALWKRTRHPRVADLIDRVSARFETVPVRAASVPERVKKLEKLVARAKTDPTLVPSVLATEWPGTWQGALPMLRAVLRLPEDPRVARALAEQVDATRYDTWTSKNFYRPLFTRLNKLGDRRQLELLEKQLTRAKPTYYVQDMRALEEKAIARHRALPHPKPLSAADEQFVSALEAVFAGAVSSERSRKQSGAALLDAVYADPANLAARQVYGDWLVEHADPRGELIALELANDPQTEGRRRALIKRHWKQWLGPVSDWFEAPPEFELGFPCAGTVDSFRHHGTHSQLDEVLEAREWRTFRKLKLNWTARRVSHPNFPLLTELLGFALSELPALLEQGSATIQSLQLSTSFEPVTLKREAFRSLPALRRLTMSATQFDQVLPALTPSIETLHFEHVGEAAVGQLLERVAPLTSVTTVEFSHARWMVRFDRGFSPVAPPARKGFTTLELLRFDHSILELLANLPDSLEALTFTSPYPLTEPDAQARAVEVMKRFPRLASPFVAQAKPDFGPHVSISLSGVALGEPKKIPRVWEILTEGFGAKFDGFSIGYGTGFFELGDDPVARLVGRASKKANVELRLKQREGPAGFALLRDKGSHTNGKLPLTDRAKFCDAFEALIAFTRPSGFAVTVGHQTVRLDTKDAIARHPGAVRTLIMEAK